MTLPGSDHRHAYLAAELIGKALGAEVALIFLATDFPTGKSHNGLSLQGLWKQETATTIHRYLCPADGPISWCAIHREPVVVEGPLLELLRMDLGELLANSSHLVLTPLEHESRPEFLKTSLGADKFSHRRGLKPYDSQILSPTVVGVLGVGFTSPYPADAPDRADTSSRILLGRVENISTLATRLMITISQLSQGSDSFESGIDHFLSSTAALVEVLGADSIELLRIAVVKMSAWQSTMPPYEQAEHFDRLIRLVKSILPPHFPIYVGPDGDLLIAFDKMMTELLLKRIEELLLNLRTSCPAIALSEIARVDLANYSALQEDGDNDLKEPFPAYFLSHDSAPNYLAEDKHKGPLRLAIRQAVDSLCPVLPSSVALQSKKAQKRKTKSSS